VEGFNPDDSFGFAARLANDLRNINADTKQLLQAKNALDSAKAPQPQGSPNYRRAILGDTGLWLLPYLPGYEATNCTVMLLTHGPNCGVGGWVNAGVTVGIPEAKLGLAAESLAPQIAKNFTRFVNKLPRGARDVTVRDLPGGGKVFQAEVPGRVPGSKAVYEKQVDPAGRTIQVTKTTFDPAGNIVHVKDKMTGEQFP